MRAIKIILRILLVLAMLLITGDWLLQRVFLEKVPRVVMSSISPDGKWICELVKLAPQKNRNLTMVSAGRNRGGEQGVYDGEVYVCDMDSIPPSDETEFSWDGNVVTVRKMFIDRFVKIKVDEEGSELVDSSERQRRSEKGK